MTSATRNRQSSPALPLPIRPGMDVYSAYQNEYIGSVATVHEQGRSAAAPTGKPGSGGSNAPQAETGEGVDMTHEQGHGVSPLHHVGSKMLGEEMGPFPTMAVGNTGPKAQDAEHAYAAAPGRRFGDVVSFDVRTGRINPLAPLLHIPVSAVRSISMERILLDLPQNRIPDTWRH